MTWILYIIFGVIIGVANIIPGVSGGTMAVVLNIYDKLIDSVSNFRKDFKKSIMFLLPIGIGAVLGIVAFSKLIEFLLTNYPLATNFFFIGLILGSIPMIFKRATEDRFRLSSLVPFLLFLIGMLVLSSFSDGAMSGEVVSQLSTGIFIKLLVCSAIAAAAMILPGVSGSMVMVILGTYNTVLTAISSMNILMLVPVGIGVLIGIVGGAKVIDLCLKKFPQATFFAILGLILGSIYPLIANAGFSFSPEGIVAIVLMIVAAGISLAFSSEKLKAKIEARTKNM
ncbi:MAG: DUF368 domain-containing protein [Christensenellales bacterium]|jgi:putative membrane protein